jgi:hypothetical protein
VRCDAGFVARFDCARGIYLPATVRERDRALRDSGTEAAPEDDESDEADDLDANVLGSVYLAGERFDRMVKRVKVA